MHFFSEFKWYPGLQLSQILNPFQGWRRVTTASCQFAKAWFRAHARYRARSSEIMPVRVQFWTGPPPHQSFFLFSFLPFLLFSFFFPSFFSSFPFLLWFVLSKTHKSSQVNKTETLLAHTRMKIKARIFGLELIEMCVNRLNFCSTLHYSSST